MLTIAPERSRWRALGFASVAALAFAATWLAGIPIWLKLVLSLVLVAYGLRLGMQRGFSARLDGAGAWSVIAPDGEAYPAELLGSSFSSTLCVVLHFKTARGRVAVPVFRDGIDAETYRQLRVHLTCSGTRQPDSGMGLLP